MKLTVAYPNGQSLELMRVSMRHLNSIEAREGEPKGMPVFWAVNEEGYIVLWPKPSDEVLAHDPR